MANIVITNYTDKIRNLPRGIDLQIWVQLVTNIFGIKAEATRYIRIYINLDYSLSLRYSAWCVRRAWYIWKLDKSIRHNFSCSQNAFFLYHSVVRLALVPWTRMFHQPTIRNYFTDFTDSQPRYVLSMFLNFLAHLGPIMCTYVLPKLRKYRYHYIIMTRFVTYRERRTFKSACK